MKRDWLRNVAYHRYYYIITILTGTGHMSMLVTKPLFDEVWRASRHIAWEVRVMEKLVRETSFQTPWFQSIIIVRSDGYTHGNDIETVPPMPTRSGPQLIVRWQERRASPSRNTL